jgi:hypothetical protein
VRIHRLAIATAVTALFGVAAPFAAQAAQAPQSAYPAADQAHRAAAHRAAEPPKSAVLFGLSDHWEPQMAADDKQLGVRSGIVGTFLNWATTKPSSIVNYADWANQRKAVPMVDLYPPTTVSLASIAAGSQDRYLIADAKALHAWNHPFMFRLFPEMNGAWESYAPGQRGNTAKQFVAAWRHVYRLFQRYHARKVVFVWNPDKEFTGQQVSFRQMWPGRKYVDWVGLDLYNSNDTAHGVFPSANDAMAQSIKDIRKLTHKPLVVAEIGVANFPRKGRWIKRALTRMSRVGVKAVVWFNEIGHSNWRLDSSSAALRATRRILARHAVAWPGHNGSTLRRDNRFIRNGHW